MTAQLTFVHALSPLHAGIGQGAGVIDLPIAREKATNLPFLPGSSIKGALSTRAFNRGDNDKIYTYIFGPKVIPETDNRASMVQFADQKLLLLPIRSLAGTFAWVTSPYILRRLARDIADVEFTQSNTPSTLTVPTVKKTSCLIASDNAAIALKVQGTNKIYLEDLELTVQSEQTPTNATSQWAEWIGSHVFPGDDDWRRMLTARFCIVHDDIFNFLCTTATEITTRIHLQENIKTVQEGGLWYEEALPTETILYGIVTATPHKDEAFRALLKEELTTEKIFSLLADLGDKAIQLGGKATVGRGLCRVLFSNQ